MRYALFCGDGPGNGGWLDVLNVYETLEEAKQEDARSWAHIVDLKTARIVSMWRHGKWDDYTE
jgi:hypothetical protein